MAAEDSTGGDNGLTSRPTTAQVSPWPASGGAVDVASEDSAVPGGVERSISSSAGSDSERGDAVPSSNLVLHRLEGAGEPLSSLRLEEHFRHAARDNNQTSSAGGEVRISETRLSEAIKKLRGAVATRYSPAPTIYRVPDELVKYGDDRKDYDPVAVYLGGFANKDKRRESKLEAYKWCCVRQLVGRHGLPVETDEARELLRGCLDAMKLLLPRVRASYYELLTEEGNENDDELAEMMLLDGCLILHCLLTYARAEREEDDDWTQVYGRCFVWESVTRDLLLLENQIPFFVIKELFQLLKNEGESEELLFTGSHGLFRPLGLKMRDPEERNNVHHLLHLFYMSVGFPQPSVSIPHRREELPQWIPCAKELEEAGVRFRKRRNATSFLDISFDFRRGVLEIPPLQLYDSSSKVFRNLIAFEQVYPDTRCEVSIYAAFMDCLIKTPEDMRILHLRGILVNQMSGEQDTSRFFSKICARVHYHAVNYLVRIMDDVSRYKNSRRHKWRAALVRNYFSSPWQALSVLAAVLLVFLTVVQTFFTVYAYFKHSK